MNAIQFINFINQISKASGQTALCEAIKKAYVICEMSGKVNTNNMDAETDDDELHTVTAHPSSPYYQKVGAEDIQNLRQYGLQVDDDGKFQRKFDDEEYPRTSASGEIDQEYNDPKSFPHDAMVPDFELTDYIFDDVMKSLNIDYSVDGSYCSAVADYIERNTIPFMLDPSKRDTVEKTIKAAKSLYNQMAIDEDDVNTIISYINGNSMVRGIIFDTNNILVCAKGKQLSYDDELAAKVVAYAFGDREFKTNFKSARVFSSTQIQLASNQHLTPSFMTTPFMRQLKKLYDHRNQMKQGDFYRNAQDASSGNHKDKPHSKVQRSTQSKPQTKKMSWEDKLLLKRRTVDEYGNTTSTQLPEYDYGDTSFTGQINDDD